MTTPAATPQRTLQFGIFDAMLLTTACAFGLAVVPITAGGIGGPLLAIGIFGGLTAAGSAISYPMWRFLLPRRFTVLAVNHLAYALTVIVLAIGWDDDILRIVPFLLGGPLSYVGHTHTLWQAFPFVREWWGGLILIACMLVPTIAMMLAHTFRPNVAGVVLTSMGAAIWHLIAIGGILSRMI